MRLGPSSGASGMNSTRLRPRRTGSAARNAAHEVAHSRVSRIADEIAAIPRKPSQGCGPRRARCCGVTRGTMGPRESAADRAARWDDDDDRLQVTSPSSRTCSDAPLRDGMDRPDRRYPVPPRVRLRVLERFGRRCDPRLGCGRPFAQATPGPAITLRPSSMGPQPREQLASALRVVRATEDRGRHAGEVAELPQAAPACRHQGGAQGRRCPERSPAAGSTAWMVGGSGGLPPLKSGTTREAAFGRPFAFQRHGALTPARRLRDSGMTADHLPDPRHLASC